MKKKLSFLLFITLLVSFSSIYAEEIDFSRMSDIELTKDQAEIRIKDFQATVADLELKLKNLDGDIETLKKQLDEAKRNLEDCQSSIYALLGATKADVDSYRQQLGIIEGKIRDMQRLSDDVLAERQDQVLALEAELNNLRGNKIACMREFYNKIIQMAKEIKGLYREKKITGYTVGTWAKDRDCLWNIAGKMEIYGDPFQWPKIWQSNTDIIRNPDIIHPGQVLQIPPSGPKTSDEIKAERKYWRKKHAAMQQQTPEQEAKQQKGE